MCVWVRTKEVRTCFPGFFSTLTALLSNQVGIINPEIFFTASFFLMEMVCTWSEESKNAGC